MEAVETMSRAVLWSVLTEWLDSHHRVCDKEVTQPRVQWIGCVPFVVMHLACLAVLWVGCSAFCVWLALGLYGVRMFAITGFYHRYFSHRTFKTARWVQFVFGLWGMTAIQKGPLWWAAHHRHHHRFSDAPQDVHSPIQRGFWWSHLGWITSTANLVTHYDRVPELARFPELVFINRFDWLVPALYAAALWMLGSVLQKAMPSLHTSGLQVFVWGFFVSTVLLYHGTFTINSLCHQWGSRRYNTNDDSRNNALLALVTLGEGWHNNHHYYTGSVRQGFYWWEIDMTFYGLWVMQKLGLIWDLNPIAPRAYDVVNHHRFNRVLTP